MSSNESFVLMLRQAKDCVTVGQPTFGSSGNPKPFELGNGVTALIPSWQDLLPDGSQCEGIGVKPDVLVECTAKDLETHDPILAKALELLRKKVAPAK
jgi:C-terminal processing protease CtpA/Prc